MPPEYKLDHFNGSSNSTASVLVDYEPVKFYHVSFGWSKNIASERNYGKTREGPAKISYWPSSYYFEVFGIVERALYDVFRRLIVWFAVLMALIRFVVIKNAMSPTFQKFSETFFGLIVILISMLLSCGVTGIRYSHEKIMNGSYKIPKECVSKFPPNFKARIYLPLIDEEFWKNNFMYGTAYSHIFIDYRVGNRKKKPEKTVRERCEHFLKFSVCVFFCSHTIFHAKNQPKLIFFKVINLYGNKRKVRNFNRNSHKTLKNCTKPDHTTKMITLMTAASIIAECPIGILYVVLSSSDTFQGFYMLAADMSSIWEIFPAINSSTHCLICFIISTQYRKAVEDTFSFLVSTKKDTSVISVSSKSKSGSVANQADKRRKSEY
ncbi:Protein CBG16981 [Caenorhabditis briggsae]|uniref:Protein CBG16981 n=1 Tax=Caenorhabditis briggsae TaxID=6238 RepID=A8XQ69_CAEBR|nr:Protein CBG16981 [Caenorhabditis briggsae]CAP34795.1 Protein CBG16981 [Caenorhabditis briggsae]